MLTDEQKREILAKCREEIDCFEARCSIAVSRVGQLRCCVDAGLIEEIYEVFCDWCDEHDLDPEEILDFDEVEDELFWFDDGTPAPEPQRDQDSFDEGQDSIKGKVWDVINMMEAYTKKDDLGNLPKKTLIEIIVKTNDALHEIAR